MLVLNISIYNCIQYQLNLFKKKKKIKFISRLATFTIPFFFKVFLFSQLALTHYYLYVTFNNKNSFFFYRKLKLLIEKLTFFNSMGCKTSLRIKGFSNRLFIRRFLFIFRIGFSHLKILLTPVNFTIRLFKRRLLYFFTTQRSYLVNFSKRVIMMKPRHLYKDVGIRFSKEIVQLREKKSRDKNKRKKRR